MGRAIEQENKLAMIEQRQESDHARIKFLEDRLAELMPKGTRIHHVDLVEDVGDTRDVKVEGVEVEPDEEFTAPVKTKKRRRAKATI